MKLKSLYIFGFLDKIDTEVPLIYRAPEKMVTALIIIIEIMRGVSLSAVLMQRDQSHPRTVGKGQNTLLSAIVGNPFTMNICIIENKKCGTKNHNNTIAIKI